MRTEAELETAVVKYVESQGGLALKLVLLNLRGFPDRTILFPGGRICFLELKHPSGCGRVSKQQEGWLRWLESFGFKTLVSSDYMECVGYIDEVKK